MICAKILCENQFFQIHTVMTSFADLPRFFTTFPAKGIHPTAWLTSDIFTWQVSLRARAHLPESTWLGFLQI